MKANDDRVAKYPGSVRTEGPTPLGGAYAIMTRDDEGRMHIIEYDKDGKSLGWTTSISDVERVRPLPSRGFRGSGEDVRRES